MTHTLSVTNHRRDSAGLQYVYPVMSRRAGGLSVGINLNTNNACNWRCIYCQVPNLTRGSAPAIDLDLLEQEQRAFLTAVLQGDFFDRRDIPAEQRQICDLAMSGNGEPTSSRQFEKVVELLARVKAELDLPWATKIVLITNGSLVRRKAVQAGVRRMSELNGEVWFKLDSATEAGIKRINNVDVTINSVRTNLKTVADLCPTWIQTCVFEFDNQPPAESEVTAYVELIAATLKSGVPLRGVLLYGLARQSMQPEASRLSALPRDWLESFAARIRETGATVKVSI
jgi:wyosine [tRNA(Phe)-imidazoG37] synthetase (radical SAM superfamily)